MKTTTRKSILALCILLSGALSGIVQAGEPNLGGVPGHATLWHFQQQEGGTSLPANEPMALPEPEAVSDLNCGPIINTHPFGTPDFSDENECREYAQREYRSCIMADGYCCTGKYLMDLARCGE